MSARPTPRSAVPRHAPTIGVFDSGVGGLTVLRALLEHVPRARYIYLGDTARLPYGSKSRATIVRYAVSAADFLAGQHADMLVIACNTASALSLPDIQAAVAPVPVIGVIKPGAQAAQTQAARAHSATSESSHDVLVLATAATVSSHAYAVALHGLGLAATEKSCPLLVPLVEEGWVDHPVTADVLRIYLREALAQSPDADTLLLGCTHYPLLQPLIERVLDELGRPMPIIDSATATARAVQAALSVSTSDRASETAEIVVYATDSVDRFQSLGSRFLGRPLPPVQLLDLGG